jgi:NAD-dependent dihydropyrimidine dehydrogenase PreA subunit
MIVKVNQDKCSGCGICVDACPESAISIHNNMAAIDQAICTQCEACIGLCEPGALYIEVDEAQIVPTARQPVSAKPAAQVLPEQRSLAPWMGTALTFLGQEILPRLVNVGMTVLERRLALAPAKSTPDLACSTAGKGTINSVKPVRLQRRRRFRKSQIH